MKNLLFLLLGFFLLSGCKKNTDTISWDTELLMPIAYTSLDLEDLLKDTLLSTDANNLLQVVYTDEIARLKPLDTLVALDIDPFETSVTLSSLNVEDVEIKDTFKLETILDEIDPSSLLKSLLFNSNGTNPTFIVGLLDTLNLDNFTLGPIPIDITDFVETAVFSSGKIKLSINNNTPLAMESLTIKAIDHNSTTILLEETLPHSLEPGKTFGPIIHNIVDKLGDSPISGNIDVFVENIVFAVPNNVPPDGLVKFDKEDNFSFSFELTDLEVASATAQFPAQEIANQVEVAELKTDDGVELTGGIVKTGKLDVYFKNTLPVVMNFRIHIPGASKNGEPFIVENQKVSRGSTSKPAVYNKSFSIDGYTLDLTGESSSQLNSTTPITLGQNYNILVYEIIGDMGEAKTPISLSLQDSVNIEIRLNDLQVEYVEGYIGSQIFNIGPDDIPMDFLNDLPLNNTKFENIDVSIGFENHIGVPANLEIEKLSFLNTTSGEEASSVKETKDLVALSPAKKDGTPSYSEYKIPNATNVFDIKPNQVSYGLNFITNPKGNSGHSNFASTEDEFVLTTNVNIPLSIIADEFVLSDTVDIKKVIEKPEEIQNGIINVLVHNGFPFMTNLKLTFIDENNNIVDILDSRDQIKAAPVDKKADKVLEPMTSVVPFHFDDERLVNLLSKSKRIVFDISINSEDQKTYQKIYSDYTFDVRLTGDFKVKISGDI